MASGVVSGFGMRSVSNKILIPRADSDNQCVHLRHYVSGPIVNHSNELAEFPTLVSTLLAPAQVLELSGADARAFAQSQFTSNVNSLESGAWQWSAWLDANGRVRQLFALLQAADDRLLAWLPRGKSTEFAVGLSAFVFRAKVRIQTLPDYSLLGLEDSELAGRANTAENWMLEMPANARRRVMISNEPSGQSTNASRHVEWQLEDIRAGLPWISSEVAGEFTPQALGLDRIGAISLDKGCYPGQEIVARLHYRGGNKRECVRLSVDSDSPPAAGSEIRIDAIPSSSGRILYSIPSGTRSCEALAVLPQEVPENSGLSLKTGETLTRLALKPGRQERQYGTGLA
jgi:tRNA-modifying protein YgfZ